MTECQGCGAWNNTSRTLCVLCGTPLAEIDEWDAAAELPPLPPLPDGGLRASMPTWLREPPPSAAESLAIAGVAAPTPIPDPAPLAPLGTLGPRADPRTFLTDDDFPQWLRDLAARREEAAPRTSEQRDNPPAPAAIERRAPSAWPDWPGWAGPTPPSATTGPGKDSGIEAPVGAQAASEPASAPEPDPGPDGRPPAAVVAARTLEERRGRDVWETLLLVLLFIGVIVAALWALVANGAFSPGL